MSSTPFSFESADGLAITGQRWDPGGSPVAAVQVTHGMGEHVLRYEELAQELNRAGFADPMCGFGVDIASCKAMFAGARRPLPRRRPHRPHRADLSRRAARDPQRDQPRRGRRRPDCLAEAESGLSLA
ncbi:MAG: alpha/beta hydrolase [Streptosporangiaceae bacterium]